MKKNILLFAAVALAGAMTLALNDLRAQDAPTTTPPPSGQIPPPGARMGAQPGFRGRPAASRYAQTIMFLRMSKAELQRSTDDFNGHRQSAIEACDKALQELTAVQASVQATAAAKAAAAKAAAQSIQSAPAPAPAPAPSAPPAPSQ